VEKKEGELRLRGIFNAPFALGNLLAVFEAGTRVDRFEGFASEHGAAFTACRSTRSGSSCAASRCGADASRGRLRGCALHAGETLPGFRGAA
jgi:hypothetical protein